MEEWPDEPELEKGDLLNHPHFGRCEIHQVEEDEFVSVRLRGGKMVDIKLEVCKITPAGEKDGKRIFNCEVMRKRI